MIQIGLGDRALTDARRIRTDIRRHRPALRRQYGVRSLGLFGSYARGEQGPRSDVDLLVELDAIRAIEVIGEAAKNVPPSIRRRHPEIPWVDIVGMPSKLVHDYFGVDLGVVWATVQEDLAAILPAIERLREEMEP